MFWIRDILGQIRIRRSVPLSNGSGFGSGSRSWSFLSGLQDANQKSLFAYYFLKSQNSRNQGFSYYFCLIMVGSGSGSVPLNKGPGSERLTNLRILRIPGHCCTILNLFNYKFLTLFRLLESHTTRSRCFTF
jgi:hypothetical protein